eukprot:1309551-Amorphochlora_amoeboformis.AAC.1
MRKFICRGGPSSGGITSLREVRWSSTDSSISRAQDSACSARASAFTGFSARADARGKCTYTVTMLHDKELRNAVEI